MFSSEKRQADSQVALHSRVLPAEVGQFESRFEYPPGFKKPFAAIGSVFGRSGLLQGHVSPFVKQSGGNPRTTGGNGEPGAGRFDESVVRLRRRLELRQAVIAMRRQCVCAKKSRLDLRGVVTLRNRLAEVGTGFVRRCRTLRLLLELPGRLVTTVRVNRSIGGLTETRRCRQQERDEYGHERYTYELANGPNEQIHRHRSG